MGLKIDVSYNPPVMENPGLGRIISRVCNECALVYDEELCAGVILTGDSEIRDTNREFRNIDEKTDVLSFPLIEGFDGRISYSAPDRDMDTGCILLGDIMISMDTAESQALDYGHSLEREVAFLACHGMLHLLGFDHDTPDRESVMRNRQREILGSLGYSREE